MPLKNILAPNDTERHLFCTAKNKPIKVYVHPFWHVNDGVFGEKNQTLEEFIDQRIKSICHYYEQPSSQLSAREDSLNYFEQVIQFALALDNIKQAIYLDNLKYTDDIVLLVIPPKSSLFLFEKPYYELHLEDAAKTFFYVESNEHDKGDLQFPSHEEIESGASFMISDRLAAIQDIISYLKVTDAILSGGELNWCQFLAQKSLEYIGLKTHIDYNSTAISYGDLSMSLKWTTLLEDKFPDLVIPVQKLREEMLGNRKDLLALGNVLGKTFRYKYDLFLEYGQLIDHLGRLKEIMHYRT